MRVSCIEGDLGYIGSGIGHKIKVYFNGVQLLGVFVADEENRFVKQYCADEKGCFIFEDKKKGLLKYEVLYGDVYLEMPDYIREIINKKHLPTQEVRVQSAKL